MYGEELVDTFVAATGLPEKRVKEELMTLINKNGLRVEQLTLEDLRVLMVKYLQSEILKAKAHFR